MDSFLYDISLRCERVKLCLSFIFSSFELKNEDISDFEGHILISLTVKERQIQITDKTRIIPSFLILNSIWF